MPPPTGNHLSPEVHAKLDKIIQSSVSPLPFNSQAHTILYLVLSNSQKAYAPTWPIDIPDMDECKTLLNDINLKLILESSYRIGEYSAIRERCKWHLMPILAFTHSSQAQFHTKTNLPSPHYPSMFEATER